VPWLHQAVPPLQPVPRPDGHRDARHDVLPDLVHGKGAQGPGGEVFTLGLRSHVLKPLLTGFVAPTVGLGMHHGYVYVGELTGQDPAS
jgi:hypothetical protein